jgi:tetratricopeptide (TPR) repeat protein
MSTPASSASSNVSRIRRRHRRAPRAAYSNYFVHLIFFETKFRWALVTFIIAAVLVGCLLPKVWITSPKHLPEVIRVSGLDLLQAWNLKRTARAEEAARRTGPALSAWTAAVGNNMADAESNRGLLNALASQPKPGRNTLGLAVGQTRFLLRLTETNATDAVLAARVFAAYGLFDEVLRLLPGPATNLPPEGITQRLVALFQTGRMSAFGDLWTRECGRLGDQPLAQLYHAAWLAGWGPPAGARDAVARLETAAADPAQRVQALQLLAAFHASRLDVSSYEKVLLRLNDRHEDRVIDHVRFWQMLEQTGQRDRAIALAKEHAVPPESGTEAEFLVQVWRRLGLTTEAVDFARQQLRSFGYQPGLWVALADLLIDLKRWDDLRALSVELRQSRLRQSYESYGWFLEGIADHHANRLSAAEALFMQAATNTPPSDTIGFRMAQRLQGLGYAAAASRLLQQSQRTFENEAAFWRALVAAGYEARQGDVVLAASERLYELNRNDAMAMNNFAASLLVNRVRSSDAIGITLNLMARAPSEIGVRLNHAGALAQNNRFDDAMATLRPLTNVQLSELHDTLLNYLLFEIHSARGRTNEAAAAADRVQARFLFPSQQEWMATRRAHMTPL